MKPDNEAGYPVQDPARILKGGGGVQAYNFGNFNYEIRVEGEGQDTYRLF